jgi:NADPH:quinone reductase-like Zn-dependent oxidoreductase
MSEAYRIQHIDEAHSHLSPTFLDNLTLHTVPIPSPGPEAVLIRMRAVSLNYRDLLIVAGSPLYPTRARSGLIPCLDGAGEIVSTGPNSKWKDSIGDTVIANPTTTWIDGDITAFSFETALGGADTDGLLAQYVVVEDPWVVLAPKNLSFEEAAALPCAGGTAMHVLSSIFVGQGTTVVAQGTGGVSCFIIQVRGV